MRFWYVIYHRKSKVEFELQLNRVEFELQLKIKNIQGGSKIKWKNFSSIYRNILCWLLLFPRFQSLYSWYYQRKAVNSYIETYNATGPSATEDHIRSIKNAVILRVTVQRATSFAQYRDTYVIYAGWPEQ